LQYNGIFCNQVVLLFFGNLAPDVVHGAEVKMPPQFGTFKQAQKVGKQAEAEQAELGFG
jgi:hypothetical protein